jgi:hypothetical protein
VKRSGIIFRPATDTAMPKTWRTALPTFTVLWLILAGTLLLTAWTWPKTMTGWIVTLSLGPMLYLLAEAVGDVAFWLLLPLTPCYLRARSMFSLAAGRLPQPQWSRRIEGFLSALAPTR